jgi:hypothetical protein
MTRLPPNWVFVTQNERPISGGLAPRYHLRIVRLVSRLFRHRYLRIEAIDN